MFSFREISSCFNITVIRKRLTTHSTGARVSIKSHSNPAPLHHALGNPTQLVPLEAAQA